MENTGKNSYLTPTAYGRDCVHLYEVPTGTYEYVYKETAPEDLTPPDLPPVRAETTLIKSLAAQVGDANATSGDKTKGKNYFVILIVLAIVIVVASVIGGGVCGTTDFCRVATTTGPHLTTWPLATTTTTEIVICDNGYTLYPEGNFCYKFHHQCAKWQPARDTCIAEGGDHNCDFGYWVGARDEAVEGRWTWFDGTPVDIAQWHSGEPNGGRGENCAIMLSYYGYNYTDYPCDWLVAYVCAQQ